MIGLVLAVSSWENTSGVASPKVWGAKMFDFSLITLFCLEKHLSRHTMTMFSKNLGGGMTPLAPPGYAYGRQVARRGGIRPVFVFLVHI